jgi:hypothetical protein
MNRKVKKIICIIGLIFGLFLQSCEDVNDYPTVLEIEIRDYYTNEPIPDYKIILTETKSGLFGTSFYEKDSLKSDSNGKLNYTFTAKNRCDYHIMAFDNKYQGFNKRVLQYETTNKLDLKLKPLKTISFELENKNGKYKRITFPNYLAHGTFDFIDTTLILEYIVPDSYYQLVIGLYECKDCGEYRIKQEEIWIENIDTIYLKREY